MKKVVLYSSILILLSACVVSKKKFDELNVEKSGLAVDKADCEKLLAQEKEKNSELNTQTEALEQKVSGLEKDKNQLEKDLSLLKDQYDKLSKISSSDSKQLELEIQKANNLRKNLEDKTKALEKKTAELEKKTAELDARKKELNDKNLELQKKNQILLEDRKNIEALTSTLEEREKRVQELEEILKKQEEVVEKIRSKVANSLLSFSSDELQVEVKDGKVYVSLAQNLLFKSGKYTLDSKGVEALKNLSDVLKKQTDVDIVVEGHTDDVPYKGSGTIKDNWDLSVLRATAVVRELQKNEVDPTHLFPTGRGEHSPKKEGTTTEDRALNRRIEIIISPSLDELYKLLESK